MLDERPKLRLVARDVVRRQYSSRNKVGNDRFVTSHVSLFIRIQKAEGHILEILNLLPGIALDQLNEVLKSSDSKRLTRERDFLRQDFKCDQFVSGNLTRERQPER